MNKDAAPDAQIPWNVEMLDTSDHKRLVQVMGKLKRSAGHRTDRLSGKPEATATWHTIYQSADTAIIPISFDADTVGRHRHIRQGSEVGVVSRPDFHPQPNSTRPRGRRKEIRQREQTIGYLGLVGTGYTDGEAERGHKERYSTLYPLEKNQTELLEPAFNKIIEELDLKK